MMVSIIHSIDEYSKSEHPHHFSWKITVENGAIDWLKIRIILTISDNKRDLSSLIQSFFYF